MKSEHGWEIEGEPELVVGTATNKQTGQEAVVVECRCGKEAMAVLLTRNAAMLAAERIILTAKRIQEDA